MGFRYLIIVMWSSQKEIFMIDWFQITFASASEQARLFSIVVSTCLAVILLLSNQWFINRRSKTAFITDKIEELSKSIYSYERMALDILSSLYDSASVNDKEILDKLTELVELSHNIEMLSELYFSNIKINIASIQQPILDVHHQFSSLEMNNKPSTKSYLSYSETANNFQEKLKIVKADTKKLMKNFI